MSHESFKLRSVVNRGMIREPHLDPSPFVVVCISRRNLLVSTSVIFSQMTVCVESTLMTPTPFQYSELHWNHPNQT
jgi:hypothetical protein